MVYQKIGCKPLYDVKDIIHFISLFRNMQNVKVELSLITV